MKKLEAVCIKKSYETLNVLDGVDISVNIREFVSLLGISGSGKTTLFNIIAGLEKPDFGSVIKDGTDITGKSGHIGYMQQNDLLMPWKSVIDNICLPLTISGMKKKTAHEKALSFTPMFGLSGFENQYPKALSGGMRQRAALLRTFLFSSDILLLDEPFARLDAITKAEMQQWMLELIKKTGISVLLITHDVDEALALSDKIYLLSDKPAKIISENARSLTKSEIIENLKGDKKPL